MITCTYCEREFEAQPETHAVVPFCGTYCEQSWWMSASAGKEYERLLNSSERV